MASVKIRTPDLRDRSSTETCDAIAKLTVIQKLTEKVSPACQKHRSLLSIYILGE